MAHKNDDVFDSKTLAMMLGISQASCRKLAESGKIKAFFEGRKMYFVVSSVKEYLEAGR